VHYEIQFEKNERETEGGFFFFKGIKKDKVRVVKASDWWIDKWPVGDDLLFSNAHGTYILKSE
jgi:hypothetical protein